MGRKSNEKKREKRSVFKLYTIFVFKDDGADLDAVIMPTVVL